MPRDDHKGADCPMQRKGRNRLLDRLTVLLNSVVESLALEYTVAPHLEERVELRRRLS